MLAKIHVTTESEAGCACVLSLWTDYLVKYDQEWGEGIDYLAVGSYRPLPLLLFPLLPRLELADEIWGLSSDVELFQLIG